jgi:hypothetical protein
VQFPQFTSMGSLTRLELEAMRSLYAACLQLRQEYDAAVAKVMGHYRMTDIADDYTRNHAFAHHSEVLSRLSRAAGEYERAVGLLAWRHASAATVLGTTVLDRLVNSRRPLTLDEVTRLCGEPTLGDLRAALSIPVTGLVVARGPATRERHEEERKRLLSRLDRIFYNAARLDDDKEETADEVVAGFRLTEVSPPEMDPLYEGTLEPLLPYAEELPFEIRHHLKQATPS